MVQIRSADSYPTYGDPGRSRYRLTGEQIESPRKYKNQFSPKIFRSCVIDNKGAGITSGRAVTACPHSDMLITWPAFWLSMNRESETPSGRSANELLARMRPFHTGPRSRLLFRSTNGEETDHPGPGNFLLLACCTQEV